MNQSTKKLPKVSFIIPTRNAENFLPKCLKAIRSQSYPKSKIEIIVADGGSTDRTVAIAKKYKAKVINNPDILHEPGKTRASKVATGEVLFYTDADNILATKTWIEDMVRPFTQEENIKGFLPQTIPAPDSNSLDRYLGFLFTDPLTWFVYKNAANPKDYQKIYLPRIANSNYQIYNFSSKRLPLFGLSQGVGTVRSFRRDEIGTNDDLLAGIKLIKEKGLVAYVPRAGVYHYHVSGFTNFIKKYQWRIRNNLTKEVKGMGLLERKRYLDEERRRRLILFLPYGLTLIVPTIDALKLAMKHHDVVMFWHVPASFALAVLILYEFFLFKLKIHKGVGSYE